MTETDIDEAACACGQLRLKVRAGPQYVSSCACQACQRRTGAPFGVTAFYKTEQVVEQVGEAQVWRRVADSGNWLDHRFCPQCGSTVWWEAQIRPGLVAVAGGCFADPAYPQPQRMVWTEHRAPWVRPAEGAVEYPQGPPA